MDLAGQASRLRAAAEAKPLKLPVNRRIGEEHHALTEDGLSIWYTIQISPHARIHEVLFERTDGMPSDGECQAWLRELLDGRRPLEAATFPGSRVRRFEVFDTTRGREESPISTGSAG